MLFAGSTLIEFDDVLVPLENLIGHEGDAFKILMFGALQFLFSFFQINAWRD